MRKSKRLAAVFLISLVYSVSIGAGQAIPADNTGHEYGKVRLETKAMTQTGITLAANSYASYYGEDIDNYYDQLDANQKAVYDALKEQLTPEESDPIEIRVKEVEFYAASKDPIFGEDIEVYRILQGGLDAVLKDCPELFWLKFGADGCGSSYEYVHTRQGQGYKISVKSLVFYPVLLDSYVDIKNTIVQRLEVEIAAFPIIGSTRYEKLLSIHDELAERITYDDTLDSAHDAYGALVKGRAVCEGYAEAFKLLCDREGIPCILVVGKGVTSSITEDHMWNAVRMEDGKWYGVDVTWDDQTESNGHIYHDFFLVGSSTKDESFGKKTFSQSHRADGHFTNADYSKQFTYPSMSQGKYIPDPSMITTLPPGTPTTTPPPVVFTSRRTVATKPAVIITTTKNKKATTTKAKKTDGTTTETSQEVAAKNGSVTTEKTTLHGNVGSPDTTSAKSGDTGGGAKKPFLPLAAFIVIGIAGVSIISIAVIAFIMISKNR
jgi:hypothetical protein